MSAIDHGWRQFNFFTESLIADPSQSQELLHLKLNVTLCISTDNYTLLAGDDGAVLQLTRTFNCRVWNAFGRRPSSLHAVDNLVVGTEENDGNAPQLKLWNIAEPWERATPRCTLSARVLPPKKFFLNGVTTSSVAINGRHTVIAIGFTDSSVFYYVGDFSTSKSVLPKCRTLRDGVGALGCGALSGLVVADPPGGGSDVIVFVVTETLLTSYVIAADGSLLRTITYDDCSGCNHDAWYLNRMTQQLVIAGSEVVNFYDVIDCTEASAERGRCYALARGFHKRQAIACREYVTIVVEKMETSDMSEMSSDTLLFIYDVEFRYLAFQRSLSPDAFVFAHCGEFIIFDRATGTLTQLVEVSIVQKEEYLLKRNLFDIVIGLARRSVSGRLYLLYELYGDYLYSRGDYENSIKQYIETIGHNEPSNVIRKFMNGTLISQLCTYLEAIHQRGYADPYHNNLLIAAYTKLRDVERIARFIDQSTEFREFDVDGAIKNLHAAKFVKLAARLAALHRRDTLFMRSLIEDLHEYRNAIEYLKRIPPGDACRLIDGYADVLLEKEKDALLSLVSKLIFENKGEPVQKSLLNVILRKPTHLNNELCKCIVQSGDLNAKNSVLKRLLQTQADKKDKESEELIFSLVDNKNLSHALSLTQLYAFSPLVYYALPRLNRHEELLQFMLHNANMKETIKWCSEDTIVKSWMDVISRKNVDSEQILLNKISEWSFVHPLKVLRILASSNKVKFGDVKTYIHEWFKKQNEWLIQQEAEISKNEQIVAEKAQLIEDIRNNVQRFQTNRCMSCGQTLSGSTIHYLCQHAYHSTCDDNGCCSVCWRRAKSQLNDHKADQILPQKLAELHNKLNTSVDTINGIADYIEQGNFDSKIN